MEVNGDMMEWAESMRKKLDSSTELADIVRPRPLKGAQMQASDPIKFVSKGWGYEKWIANGPEYCGKLLHFNLGKRCSWHYHKIKDETFYIQSGELLLIYGDDISYDSDENIIDGIYINWDGKNKSGKNLPSDTYYYNATVTFDVLDENESVKEIKGWVQILR